MGKILRKYLLLLAFIQFSNSLLQSQNLINNSGFEDGLNQWLGFWSRDGVGTGSIISSPVHSGTKALKIVYSGTQDWAFSTGSQFTVSPGQIYDIACWAKTDTIINGRAQFSVILYDSDKNVLDWAYSPLIFDAQKGDYKLYSSRFMVPAKVKYIEPKLIGWQPCSLYVDNFSLVFSPIQSLSGDYAIENDSIKAMVHIPFLSMVLTNKTSLKSYNIESSPIMTVDSVQNVSLQSIILHGKLLNETTPHFDIALSLNNKAVKISLVGDSLITLNSGIKFPGSIFSKSNEYMIIPRGTGAIIPVIKQFPFGVFSGYAWKSTMPFVGVTNLTDGYMVSTDDQWDASFSIDLPADQNYYTVHLINESAKGRLGYNRTIYLNLVDNGYIEMCRWYRHHSEALGHVKTLSQKLYENPNIDKLIGAVDFWGITFDITSEFLDTLKLAGMDKAIWNLDGDWSIADFSKIIDSINSKGYLSSRYDLYTDVFPPTHPEWTLYRTEGFPNDVIIDVDGQLRKGWLANEQGQPFQGYYTCSQTHLNYCQNHLRIDLSKNHYNCRFVDVETASNLMECYSTVHPTTRKQDAVARNNLLNYIKNNNKLVIGSEEAYDFAFQNVDYGEGTMTMEPPANSTYSWSIPDYLPPKSYIANNINPAIRVPLHGLTYHDVHIPTWWTGDGATRVPDYWDDKNLWNILYGTMPLYLPSDRKYWNENFEKFIDGYHLISAVTRNVGYEKMTSHQFITTDWKVQKTTFANGWNIIANFDSLPYTWNGKNLAPKGFYASDDKGNEVYKLSEHGNIIDWAFAGSRLFFNPHGTEIAKNGVRTTGSVFIKNYGEYMLVSFIGKQHYVDLNASMLPYNISNINKVYDWFTGTPIALTDAGGGWKKLQKTNNKLFYKVTLGTTDLDDNYDFQNLQLFPNPVKDVLNITSKKMISEVQISNLLGLKIYTSAEKGEKISLNLFKFRQGIYFCKIIFRNGDSVTRKIIIE
jgi:hypothetical protein